jgi:hypothetical protein
MRSLADFLLFSFFAGNCLPLPDSKPVKNDLAFIPMERLL